MDTTWIDLDENIRMGVTRFEAEIHVKFDVSKMFIPAAASVGLIVKYIIGLTDAIMQEFNKEHPEYTYTRDGADIVPYVKYKMTH